MEEHGFVAPQIINAAKAIDDPTSKVSFTFLQESAGTGKPFTVRLILAEFAKREKSVLFCRTMGIAASNIQMTQ
jgi:hypothetical protein